MVRKESKDGRYLAGLIVIQSVSVKSGTRPATVFTVFVDGLVTLLYL
jgi:hypothetical protein